MKSKIIILFLIFSIVVPVVSAILPPLTPPNIPVSGNVNFFFWNDSSDFGAGYNKFATYPQLQDTVILSATVSSASGAKTLGSFISDPFPNGMTLGPGLARYRVYLNTSSDVGVTTFDFITYNVSPTGVETRMFFGVPRSVDINTQVSSEYLISYARRNYTYFLPAERLLVRANVSTTSVVSRTGYMTVAGTSSASHAQIGYWLGYGGNGTVSPVNETYQYSPNSATPYPFWAIFAIAGIILFILAFYKKLRDEKGGINKERVVLSLLGGIVNIFAAYLTLVVDIPNDGNHVLYEGGGMIVMLVIMGLLCFAGFVYAIVSPEIINSGKEDMGKVK